MPFNYETGSTLAIMGRPLKATIHTSKILTSKIPLVLTPAMTTDIDPDTAFLIAHLSVSDIEDVTAKRKGKGRHGTPLSDEEVAFQIQMEAWKTYLTTVEDGVFAKSLERAIDTDRPLVTAIQVAEQGAADDRQAAFALDRGRTLSGQTASQICLEDKCFFGEE